MSFAYFFFSRDINRLMEQKNIPPPDLNTPMPLSYYVEQLQLTSRSNLWKWTKQGLRTHQVGGRVYISQADLQRFFNEKSGEVER